MLVVASAAAGPAAPQDATIFPLFVAVLLGGAIGFEREWNGKPAGLRTNIIVCLGAAAFTLLARNLTGADASSRVMQGIIAGVGFLGAGVLIQGGSSVHGMTTAAGIWLVTSIGIACGQQMYQVAVTVTFMALLTLLGLSPLVRWIRRIRPVGENGHTKSIPHDNGAR